MALDLLLLEHEHQPRAFAPSSVVADCQRLGSQSPCDPARGELTGGLEELDDSSPVDQ